MAITHTLVAPGHRTAPRPGFRAALAVAVAVVLSSPRLWVVGALGFTARGGLLLLGVPIITIPSPAALRPLLGDAITTVGLSSEFLAFLAALGVALVLLAILGLLLSGISQLVAFEALTAHPLTEELRGGRMLRPLTLATRRHVAVRLLIVQIATLIPALIGAAWTLQVVAEATYNELQSPSTVDLPLVARVLSVAENWILVTVLLLVLADFIGALISRRILVRAFGLEGSPGRRRWVGDRDRAPISIGRTGRALLATARRVCRSMSLAIVTWCVTLVVLAPAVLTLTIGWIALREAAIQGLVAGGVSAGLAALVMTGLFVALWVGTTVLSGIVSAIRSAIWDSDALRA